MGVNHFRGGCDTMEGSSPAGRLSLMAMKGQAATNLRLLHPPELKGLREGFFIIVPSLLTAHFRIICIFVVLNMFEFFPRWKPLVIK